MPDDFLIKYDTATKWEGRVHYILAEPQEHVKALLPLLYQLIQGSKDPSGDYECQICGQTFNVDFYLTPVTTDPLTVATYCKTCNIHIFFRSSNVPSWTKEAPIHEWLEGLRK